MNNFKKYGITMLSALILETGSTMYIAAVAEHHAMMLFWAFIAPFLNLPFTGFMLETNTWRQRFLLALSMAIGYCLGSLLVYWQR
jgi:hypothetical protein